MKFSTFVMGHTAGILSLAVVYTIAYHGMGDIDDLKFLYTLWFAVSVGILFSFWVRRVEMKGGKNNGI